MTIAMAIGLATFLAGIAGWALNRLYNTLDEKIELKNKLSSVSENAVDAKFSAKRSEEGVLALNLKVDAIEKNIKIISATNQKVFDEIKNQATTDRNKTDSFGKIITILSEDLIKRKREANADKKR